MRLGTIGMVVFRSAEIGLRRLFGLRPRPYKALFEVTSSCNSRCTTCDIWKNPPSVKKHDIGISDIDKMFRGFGRDLVWLSLSGGEVTLCEHFPDIIKSCRKYCSNLKLVTFTTNGLRPEKALEYARTIKECGFDSFITISLDGDEKVHDAIRGVPGNYRTALETFRLLKDAGFSVHYGITLGDGNREFMREGFSHHRKETKAVTFVESGGIYRKENSADDLGILESINIVLGSYRISGPGEFIEWIYLRLARRYFQSGRNVLPVACDVLRASVHIRPNGDVLPCMFLPSIGNIRMDSVPNLVKSPAASVVMKRIDQGKCPRCWMNCYAPHSIMSRPLTAFARALAAP